MIARGIATRTSVFAPGQRGYPQAPQNLTPANQRAAQPLACWQGHRRNPAAALLEDAPLLLRHLQFADGLCSGTSGIYRIPQFGQLTARGRVLTPPRAPLAWPRQPASKIEIYERADSGL